MRRFPFASRCHVSTSPDPWQVGQLGRGSEAIDSPEVVDRGRGMDFGVGGWNGVQRVDRVHLGELPSPTSFVLDNLAPKGDGTKGEGGGFAEWVPAGHVSQ